MSLFHKKEETAQQSDLQKQTQAEEAQAHAATTPTEESVRADIINVLRTIYDPEIPVNIYDLGLIYAVEVTPLEEGFRAKILMTMTAPDCPEAEYMFMDVRRMVQALDSVKDVDVELTFDPPWSPDRLSDATKLELGLL